MKFLIVLHNIGAMCEFIKAQYSLTVKKVTKVVAEISQYFNHTSINIWRIKKFSIKPWVPNEQNKFYSEILLCKRG